MTKNKEYQALCNEIRKLQEAVDILVKCMEELSGYTLEIAKRVYGHDGIRSDKK